MKRKPRETWATRKLPPLTLAEIERHLDLVARMMVRAGPKADLLLPIFAGAWLLNYAVRAFSGFGLQRQRLGSSLLAGAGSCVHYPATLRPNLPLRSKSIKPCGSSILKRLP